MASLAPLFEETQALDALRLTLTRRLAERDIIQQTVKSLDEDLAKQREEIDLLLKVLAVFHALNQNVQQKFLHSIELLVGQGLEAVFGEEITFRIKPEVRGKNIQLDFVLATAGGETDDLIGARGGGLVSVVGIILRIIVVRLLKGSVRQTVFLDEPLAHLSDQYVGPAGDLLRRLSDDLDIQIVMITHQEEFAQHADTVYVAKSTSDGVHFERAE